MNDLGGEKDKQKERPLHVTGDHIRHLIATLNSFCFSAGEEKFKREQNLQELSKDFFSVTPPKLILEFFRCTNWSLKQAQEVIIGQRLQLEAARRDHRLDFEVPYTFGFMIRLLTDFADTIGWMLLRNDISAVRNMFLDIPHHSDLINHNWESIETVLADMNADPDQVALAMDLTSFMQTGDIFVRNMRTGSSVTYEVKAGVENERLGKVFSAQTAEDFEMRRKEFVSTAKNPKHALKQIERNLNQHDRASRSRIYSASGNQERVDLKTNTPAIILESNVPEKSWSRAVRECAQGLEAQDARLRVVDNCLFFEYGRGPHTRPRDYFFRYRVSDHLGLSTDLSDYSQLRIFDVAQHTSLPGFVPQSTSLAVLGEEIQSRLLALDDYLLVYLHIPALQSFLANNGVQSTIRNMRQTEQPFRDRLMQDLFGVNKVATVKKSGAPRNSEQVLAGGMIGRIILNFLMPGTLLDIASQYEQVTEQAERLAKRRSSQDSI